MIELNLTQAQQIELDRLIELALFEDLNSRSDLTTDSLVPDSAFGSIRIIARQAGVLSGTTIAQQIFLKESPETRYRTVLNDGERLSAGGVIAEVSGPMKHLLTIERTALNFLTLMSGIASLTAKYVAAAENTSARVYDTRKTLPGLRMIQKYAVRCGGGENHRIGLWDAVLIKDNHLAWWKSSGHEGPAQAVVSARNHVPAGTMIEIEVDTLEQLRNVLSADPDIVLLDNMTNAQLTEAVSMRDQINRNVQLEASGGVNLNTVAGIAETGVDRISVGALTHSAPALDIGIDWNAPLT